MNTNGNNFSPPQSVEHCLSSMRDRPKVSICIPTHNGTPFIGETLECIRALTYPNLEVLFCDDYSTDGTQAQIQEFVSETPDAQARVIQLDSTRGIPNSWNTCIEETSGEFVKFLFQDDLLAPDSICKMVATAQKRPSVGIVFCRRGILYEEHFQPTAENLTAVEEVHIGWSRIKSFQKGQDLLADPKLWAPPLNKIGEPTAVLLRRNALEKTGGFDPAFSQLADLELWLRILQDHDAAFINEVLCHFRLHSNQQTQANISSHRIENDRCRLLLKACTHNDFGQLPATTRDAAQTSLTDMTTAQLATSAKLTGHNQKLLQELEAKGRNLTELETHIANLQSEHADATAHISDQEAHVAELEAHVAEQQATITTSGKQIQEYSAKNHVLWEEKNNWLHKCSALNSELQTIRGTWHWKLRALLGKLLNKKARSMPGAPAQKSLPSNLPATDPQPVAGPVKPSLKQAMELPAALLLEQFLAENRRLQFSTTPTPQTSILLILYNRADLTLQCLQSILAQPCESYEVILVDNNSTDATPRLLARLSGNASVITNADNEGFLTACNQAAAIARGQHLLFLNNDTVVLGNSITLANETLLSADDIGAVGGRLILPDGTLQEAGSFIDTGGSCHGYGRGADPSRFEFMFQRDTDYCSGAFLLTRRDLFESLGGFDPAYKPAYYEEVDYCVRLWKNGHRVVFDPRVSILHYEFASSAKREDAIDLQKRNFEQFLKRHGEWVNGKALPPTPSQVYCKDADHARTRILFLEDKVPHQHLGSGFTRAHCMLLRLLELDVFVTLYPTNYPEQPWDEVYSDIPRTVEVATGLGRENLKAFLEERSGYYDVILASRPHNLEAIQHILKEDSALLSDTRLVYDAEAMYCLRDFTEAALNGRPIPWENQQHQIKKEIELTQGCDALISVSALETNKFLEHGVKNIHTIGFCIKNNLGPANFNERQDILFVGSVHLMRSPNADSILWFSKEVFPRIEQALQTPCRFLVAGTNLVPELEIEVAALGNPSIKFLGKVPDLAPLYNQARIFVAPTRYAAGIPQKVCEAAASGIPVVSTSLIAQQLGWTPGEDLLVGDSADELAQRCVQLYTDPALWECIRDNSASKVTKDCSPDVFNTRLANLLNSVTRPTTTS